MRQFYYRWQLRRYLRKLAWCVAIDKAHIKASARTGHDFDGRRRWIQVKVFYYESMVVSPLPVAKDVS